MTTLNWITVVTSLVSLAVSVAVLVRVKRWDAELRRTLGWAYWADDKPHTLRRGKHLPASPPIERQRSELMQWAGRTGHVVKTAILDEDRLRLHVTRR